MPTFRSNSFSLPTDFDGDATRSAFPRELIIYDEKSNKWSPSTDEDILASIEYLAVSYRQTDFPDKLEFEKDIHNVCHIQKLKAYWLDYACTGTKQEEKNRDLYRIADVFRGAKVTLIMIRGDEDRPLSDGWLSWGDRIWTLPEALLSHELIYKIGSRFFKPISLRRLANVAYKDRHEEMMLIDGYSGKDPLPLHERVELLRKAIWKRSSGPNKENVISTNGGVFTGYPAERVYALMGFMQYRIMPSQYETEDRAFARLLETNKLADHRFPWDVESVSSTMPNFQHDGVRDITGRLQNLNMFLASGGASADTSSSSNLGESKPDTSPDAAVINLDEKITVQEKNVRSFKPDDRNALVYLDKLSHLNGARYLITGDKNDLEKAIELASTALRLSLDGNSEKPRLHNALAVYYEYRYNLFHVNADMEQSIEHRLAAVRLAQNDDPEKAAYYGRLGRALHMRAWNSKDNDIDLQAAITNQREALRRQILDPVQKARYSHDLGLSLQERFNRKGDVNDLNDSIRNFEDAAKNVSDDHADKITYLISLATSYQRRYDISKQSSDLDQSIFIRRNLLRIVPDDKKAECHYKLASVLEKSYKDFGSLNTLDEVIANKEMQVKLIPNSHPEKARYMYNLSISYKERYRKSRQLEDLNRAIAARAAALEVIGERNTLRVDILNRLWMTLVERYEKMKDANDLRYAMNTFWKADKASQSMLASTDDRKDIDYHESTGNFFQYHFEEFGDMTSLEKAISHRREALNLSDDTYAGSRNKALNSYKLGKSLSLRYGKYHIITDINASIDLFTEAVQICTEKRIEGLEKYKYSLSEAMDKLKLHHMSK